MNKELTEIVQQYDGLLWERPGRNTAVSDRFGCRVFRLPPDAELGDKVCLEETKNRLRQFFSELEDQARKPRQEFHIHLLREDIPSVGCRAATDRLVETLFEYRVTITIHFAQHSQAWAEVLDWNLALWAKLGRRSRNVWITLEGPWGAVTQEVKEAFHQRRFQFSYSDGLSQPSSPDNAENLRDLAKFGFLIPTAHYVTDKTISVVEDALEKNLDANLSSGFSLPIACQHPCYGQKDLPPVLLPEPMAYINLLGKMFTKHPHYDAIFEPLWELNSIVALGGWNQRLNIPFRIGMIVQKDGSVGVFRQVPMLAKPWKSAQEIISLDPVALRDELIAFCARELTPKANSFCATCRLRFMCGGMDSSGNDSTSDRLTKIGELICGTRQFFLEAFFWQRLKLEEVAASKSEKVDASE